ncbi:hypothetical protein [Nonomuraea wenchangensis]|uniref:hypothetical protein n=1 Tax=Nonomuraea wenchangensis TaxID=568860 RepID=UPI000B894FB3|nr:hypothetical protein [Nonomuraea wenchangensis]
MGWFEFIDKILGHLLSWPVLALIAVFLFRKPLTDLIKRIKTYEGLGQTITFGEELAQLEQEAESLGEVPALGDGRTPEEADDEAEPVSGIPAEERAAIDRFVMLAEQAPSAAIIDAWLKIELSLHRLVKLAGLPSDGRNRSAQAAARALVGADVLPRDILRQLDSFRSLRNRVAHGDHVPTPGEALAYADAAYSVWKFLEHVGDEWEQRR